MIKPPLDLTVEVTTPDGTQRRWASHLAAADRPQGIQFSTARMDGFKTAGCSLPRRIDLDYPDLNLLDDLAFIGGDGSVAFEGRISALPRSMDSSHAVNVQAVGYMAHAKDRQFRDVYVDRDVSHWQTMTSKRRQNRILASYVPYDGQVDADDATQQAGLRLSLSNETWGTGNQPHSEMQYRPGVALGSVYYAWTKGSQVDDLNTGYHWAVLLADDDTVPAFDITAELRGGGPGTGTLAATTSGRKVAVAEFNFTGAYGTASAKDIFWTCLAVYGNQGLTKQGSESATTAKGYYSSDLIKDIAGRYCPKLNTAGVQSTTYVNPQIAFLEPITPYDAFLVCNAPHLWSLAVWENRTLYYGPVDLTDYTWQIRTDDPGVSLDLQGDSIESLANGVVVTYQDVNSGRKERLTPDANADLADASTENPYNRAGYPGWLEITLSFATTQDVALDLGRIALAEYNAPRAPGTITVRGHIRDRAGNWQPVWKVRADDTIAIVNHQNDSPRLIIETSYDHDPRTLRISVDAPSSRLDAVLDRFGTALQAAGLT